MSRCRILDEKRGATHDLFIHEQILHTIAGDAGSCASSSYCWPFSAGVHSVFGGSFQMFQFEEHAPLVHLDTYRSGVFLEDRKYVAGYRTLVACVTRRTPRVPG
jgi:hypothetical protein